MYLSALLSLCTQRMPFELDFRVTQVLTDSSGTSRYGDSGSILKNRKIGALTYKSELAVSQMESLLAVCEHLLFVGRLKPSARSRKTYGVRVFFLFFMGKVEQSDRQINHQ